MSQQYYYPALSVSADPTAATAANQVLEIAQLTAINTNTGAALTNTQLRASAVPVSLTSTTITGSVAVTGPLTDTQLRAVAVPISAAALPLPSGAATAAKQPALGTAGSASADVLTVQGVASMTALKVDGSAVTQPVSGTVTINALTNASIVKAQLQDNAGTAITVGQKAMAASLPVTLASDQSALSVSLAANQSVNNAQVNGVTILAGAGPTGTGAQRVTVGNVAAATLANVASSATSVTLLASTAARMGATFYNDSTAILYLKFGATASSTSYTIQMAAASYYELPQPCYSGIIDGIWASANGNCRVTSW